MTLACEDLAQYGVVLIPPSTEQYFELLADIEERLQRRPKGSPPVSDDELSFLSEHHTSASAILVNRASVAIASVAYIWWVRIGQDRIIPHSALPGTNASVLLPFELNDRVKKFDFYWNTIFPTSKRLMVCDVSWYGDNTDVRLPAPDELSQRGRFFSFGGGRPDDIPDGVKLTLDGVFFADGAFAGPNRLRSWEHTLFSAEAHLACAEVAREAHNKSVTPHEYFLRVQELTGQAENARLPPPLPATWYYSSQPLDPEPLRQQEQHIVGWQIFNLRKRVGDEGTIKKVAAWAEAPVPRFHRL